MHLPMSPLGEDHYVGEKTGMIRNSLEVSGRFWGFQTFIEGRYRKLPEEVGIRYIGMNGTLPV